jgi:hypothetical protein
MPNIEQFFPSKYIRVKDLQGKRVAAIIVDASPEIVGEDERLALTFRGKVKKLILNKTNASTIANAFGPETESWTGRTIELFEASVEFRGKRTPAIRVEARGSAPTKTKSRAAPEPEEPPPINDYDGPDDENDVVF